MPRTTGGRGERRLGEPGLGQQPREPSRDRAPGDARTPRRRATPWRASAIAASHGITVRGRSANSAFAAAVELRVRTVAPAVTGSAARLACASPRRAMSRVGERGERPRRQRPPTPPTSRRARPGTASARRVAASGSGSPTRSARRRSASRCAAERRSRRGPVARAELERRAVDGAERGERRRCSPRRSARVGAASTSPTICALAPGRAGAPLVSQTSSSRAVAPSRLRRPAPVRLLVRRRRQRSRRGRLAHLTHEVLEPAGRADEEHPAAVASRPCSGAGPREGRTHSHPPSPRSSRRPSRG